MERNEMESFFTQKMLAETCSFTIKGLIHKVFFVIFVNFWKRAIVKNDFLLESYHNLVKNLRWIFFLKKVRGKNFFLNVWKGSQKAPNQQNVLSHFHNVLLEWFKKANPVKSFHSMR